MYVFVKVVTEWVGAVFLLIVLAPVFVVFCVLVKSTSPGPIFFTTVRLGKNGKPFTMYKFRTMKVNAPPLVSADHKTIVHPNDERLTSIGGWMRRGFDELPQLLNIVLGHMSLIGPRPDADWMLAKYTPTIRRRLVLRPGITGLGQVLDSRGVLRTAEGYAVDGWYCEHVHLMLDLWIVWATFLYVCGVQDIGRNRLSQIQKSYDANLFEPLR